MSKQQEQKGNGVLPCVSHNLFGYFKHGGVKWLLVEIDGNMLKGIDITPKGMIHTLHIHKKEVYELVTLNCG
jgi:hypothetical protein